MSETKEHTTPKIYYPTLSKKEQEILMGWWAWLKGNKGQSAQLRRCDTPEMILPQTAFHRLCRPLPWREKQDLLALATVAGLLSHIEESPMVLFAAQLGKAKDGGDSPRFSELRFQQLLASEDHQALFDRMRRAIHLLGRTANILSVADGVFHWAQDRKDGFSEQPSQRFHYAWAKAYYGEVFKYQKENR